MTTLLVTSVGAGIGGDWAFWAACFLVGAVVALALGALAPRRGGSR